MKRLLPVLLASCCLNFVFAQNDNAGPGRALKFDGVDDLVELGNIYDNIALPVTLSAWIYLEPVPGVITYPIFDSQDNSFIYNGFTIVVSTLPHIGLTYGDGEGGNNPAYRASKGTLFQFLTGRWAHITGVMRGANNMDIYLNGQNMGGNYDGSSTKPMNSNSPTEIAKIGYWFSNGLTYRFKGLMDEVRIWNRALTEEEIRNDMCRKLTGNETGLIGYWTFDETSGNIVKDKSTNHFDGVLIGNPQRVYSGAPIGDESAFLYTSNWLGQSLTLGDLKAEAITNDPDGIHLYKVNSIPSQTGGLDGNVSAPYYGVFVANQQNGNDFTLQYKDNLLCRLFRRDDNSNPGWTELDHASNLPDRIELIPVAQVSSFSADLGQDKTLCDQSSFNLTPALDNAAGKSFLWSTGETSSSITVTTTGKYAVLVSEGCESVKDTISVSFLSAPPAFSLGSDEVSCSFAPRILKPVQTTDVEFTWQDGSHTRHYEVKDFGTYWLKVENSCGSAADSVTFSRLELDKQKIPNVITPNGDGLNQYFVLDPLLLGSRLLIFNRWGQTIYYSPSYQNEWDGSNVAPGTYFYTLTGACADDLKGPIHVVK